MWRGVSGEEELVACGVTKGSGAPPEIGGRRHDVRGDRISSSFPSSNGGLEGGEKEERNPPKAAATMGDEEASYVLIHHLRLKDPRMWFPNMETDGGRWRSKS